MAPASHSFTSWMTDHGQSGSPSQNARPDSRTTSPMSVPISPSSCRICTVKVANVGLFPVPLPLALLEDHFVELVALLLQRREEARSIDLESVAVASLGQRVSHEAHELHCAPYVRVRRVLPIPLPVLLHVLVTVLENPHEL